MGRGNGRSVQSGKQRARCARNPDQPLRDANARLEVLFRSILAVAEMELIPDTLAIWEDAARIRAQTGLSTPDALHAATALSVGCTLFVTNDTDFQRIQRLPVVVLDDLDEARTES